MDDGTAHRLVGRAEELLERLESLGDPLARELATDTVQAVLELYGEGLGRITSAVGEATATALAEDELVAHLLLLHGLHPVDLETRVRSALEEVRPYLESHGGDVELLGVERGVARLRLQGSCDGCPSSAMTLKLAIEDAIAKAAPDVEAVEAEGAEPEPAPAPALLQIETVQPGGAPRSWSSAGALSELGPAGTLVKRVDGEPVLFLRAEGGGLYAYRRECPRCGSSLEGGALDGDQLACPACRSRYDVRRAGRSLDGSKLGLVPFPLLVGDAGDVQVAVRAGAG